VPEALDVHRPDIVFYQAGVDALADDALGRLALSPQGLATRDRRVFAWCVERDIPAVITMGGGYARPIERSIDAHANVWRAARAAVEGRRAHGKARSPGAGSARPRAHPPS
jgi:acetoin utilization deacetylase AcuC-like enzyme